MGIRLEHNKKLKKIMGCIESKKSNIFLKPIIIIENLFLKVFHRLRKNYKGIILEKYGAIYFPVEKVATRTLLDVFECKKPRKLVKKKNYFENYKDYYKFAFVRNPYDRLVSCYKNKIIENRKKEDINIRNNFSKNMSFNDFVKEVSKIPDIRADQHIKSQSFFLEYKKTGKLLVDFVGRFENLEEDYKKICKKIGMKPKDKLSSKNKSKNRKSYKDYYDEETKKLVRERYKRDFELFGYGF